jgi:glycyl-tRNA synthetase alpha chain
MKDRVIKVLTFQEIILKLEGFWTKHGCVLMQSYDYPVGAGTSHPATFLKSLGSSEWNCVFAQSCRRPTDGRYGDSPNRLQHYYQMQVVLKPAPANIQNLYLSSLQILGLDVLNNDIRFVEDNWENPSLGAWGVGWEVWFNGMEITQFTYFQQVGGLVCSPVLGEITYGLERLAMYIQKKETVYDIVWAVSPSGKEVLYKDVFLENEKQQSKYNFESSDAKFLFQLFNQFEHQASEMVNQELVLPAYDLMLQMSHAFNQLDARGVISSTERAAYIARIRKIANSIASAYLTEVNK